MVVFLTSSIINNVINKNKQLLLIAKPFLKTQKIVKIHSKSVENTSRHYVLYSLLSSWTTTNISLEVEYILPGKVKLFMTENAKSAVHLWCWSNDWIFLTFFTPLFQTSFEMWKNVAKQKTKKFDQSFWIEFLFKIRIRKIGLLVCLVQILWVFCDLIFCKCIHERSKCEHLWQKR